MLKHSSRIALVASAAMGLALLTGCAVSVPLQPTEVSNQAKAFAAPASGKAGIYVYRQDVNLDQTLKKDVYIDGICLGQSAPGVFFYTEVEGDKTHSVATEGAFTPNEVEVYTESGKLYFFEQEMKFGILVASASINQVDERTGKEEVTRCQQAVPGTCSESY